MPKHRLRLEPGDVLAIDNGRKLHGRTPISGNGARHYHEERNHQSLGGQLITRQPQPVRTDRMPGTPGWAPALLRSRGGLKRPDRVFAHYAIDPLTLQATVGARL